VYRRKRHPDMLVAAATAYAKRTSAEEGEGDDDVITFTMPEPEELSSLGDEDLLDLHEQATAAFRAIYEAEGDPTADDVATMAQLADAVDALRGETDRREQEREENRTAAEALASRVTPPEGEDEEDEEEGEPEEGEPEPAEAESAETVAASARPRSVTVPGARSRQRGARRRQPVGPGAPIITANADLGAGVSGGDEVTIDRVAEALLRRTQGMTASSYEAAFHAGRRQQNSIGLLSIVKGFPDDLVASADNGQEVINRAVDQSRLPGGSLLASGGWCAPSETVYDLFELESADGLVSVPEFQVIRGGIRWTPGPDFSSLFSSTGFTFTESDDEDGNYGGDGEPGDKPCFKVDCPEFEEERLQVTGLCITAGILQNRAYPEVTARTIRGALVGHQHRLAGQTIQALAAGSDAVVMPQNQAGALAPILDAIEIQASHYRYVHRMNDSAVLEAIFPRWVRGAVRSDLSRRLGVDMLSVPDARIAGWFRERGISAQFVYNYQDLDGDADQTVSWPTSVKFLLYAAGTWTRGSSDIISLEAIFDSALLVQNDFTALFSEEGWLVAKRGHDSREVEVEICADGATHGGVDIDCDGSVSTL
jgi:hypothetical protein